MVARFTLCWLKILQVKTNMVINTSCVVVQIFLGNSSNFIVTLTRSIKHMRGICWWWPNTSSLEMVGRLLSFKQRDLALSLSLILKSLSPFSISQYQPPIRNRNSYIQRRIKYTSQSNKLARVDLLRNLPIFSYSRLARSHAGLSN